jgi:hypothetical protein
MAKRWDADKLDVIIAADVFDTRIPVCAWAVDVAIGSRQRAR